MNAMHFRARATLVALATVSSAAAAQSLRGSQTSVDRQHAAAVAHDFTILATASQVNRFVSLGLLVHVAPSADLQLADVSYPYARPAVRTFVRRLAAQYHTACGEPLVVASLTRPADEQPDNASDESVHPAGMAVDLRVSSNSRCRAWLERTLLSLETSAVLDATREFHPPHYHVAVFPTRYVAYVDQITSRATDAASANSPDDSAASSGPSAGSADPVRYRVQSGDSLWELARRFDATVEDLKAMNGLRDDKIIAGTVLLVPPTAR